MADDAVKVDAIVVGGGPAGIAAAYTLAKQGLQVILVERGEYAGSKNLGGLLYGTVLDQMIPKFYETAPWERHVIKRQIFFLGADEHVGISFGSQQWGQPPYNHTFTVHRAQFDRWFAKQAEEAGASLLEGMVVDGLAYAGEGAAKKAVGVRIRNEEQPFLADAVILCDGAHSLVSEQARKDLGMRAGRVPQDFAVGVKETIGLPRGVIEDRFGLEDREGAALDFIGVPFEGMIGGGFIYTQRETVSIGFVAKLETLQHAQVRPSDVLDRFKRHPLVRKYLRGGELLEYGAHLLPEGGYESLGQMAANGVLIAGDAAGLLNTSLYKEGTNHAMESGKLAAETVIAAKQAGDFSLRTLGRYEDAMRHSIGVQDLKKYRKLPHILETTPNVLSLYPARVNRLLVEFFTVSNEPKAVIQKRAIRNFLKGLIRFRTVRDLIVARKLM